jgi:branched-chain amino acid transport system permease protein
VDVGLLSQYFFHAIIMGIIYCLMAMGITFIYSIMKMINWCMGEFYMIGSYIQFFLLSSLLGYENWFLGIPLTILLVFLIGILYYRLLLGPMMRGIERKDEYITVITLATLVLFRNIMAVLYGPYIYSPKDYFAIVNFGTLSMNGSKLIAAIGTAIITSVFYYSIKKTWIGRAFQATAQNRMGVQIAGVNPHRIDEFAFGIGCALAAASGSLLAPVFMVFPTNGAITTIKGFTIIVLGGLGSIEGAIIGAMALGFVEVFGAAFINAAYRDIYSFILLLLILAFRPKGLFGEKERLA